MRRVLALLVLGALVVAGCSDDGPSGDQARLRVDGSATVTEPDGDRETVADDEATVAFGDTVRLDEGTGTLEFADGSVYELRALDAVSVVRIAAPLELLEGEVLVTEGFPASVAVDTATLSASGVLRVDADGARATAYTGRTTLAGVGDVDELRGLRSVLLSAAAVPEPIEYDGSDPWDRRYLGDAIEFGRRLEALARGYTSELGPSANPSPSFFEAVLPALDEEREFNRDLLDPDRPVGETLVGAAIAVQGRQDNFRDRWEAIFEFRAEGAAWGLVALDQGVSSAPVLETIELAIGRSQGDLPTTTTTTAPSTSTTSPPDGSTTTTTTTTAPPDPGGDDDDDDDDDDIIGDILDPGGDPVEDLLDSLGL